MAIPAGIRAVDLMMAVPASDSVKEWYDPMRPLFMDEQSRNFEMPAKYMFLGIPDLSAVTDFPAYIVEQMDRHNIAVSMIGLDESPFGAEVRRRYPDRFVFDVAVNPNLGMEEVRRIKRVHKEYPGVKAVSFFPSGTYPQVPINDKKAYPIYATCAELGLPIFINAGVPGPRVPMAPQKTELLDEVCWFFPEVNFIMRHGAEPWDELAVKLMLKWPNLYYSTSAFAPKHYPKSVIQFANTRGADKIMYAGYFPMGLSLDRIFKELNDIPFKDEVWPKFLHDNAARVLKLAPR